MVPPVLPTGDKGTIERIVKAYGFSTRQALCTHLGVSKSTMANRIQRGNFPADWVIICSLQTGVSVPWLVFGEGPIYPDGKLETVALDRSILRDGSLVKSGYLIVDKNTIPSNANNLVAIVHESCTYFLNPDYEEINDGLWLIQFDGQSSIRELVRLPGNRVRVENGKASFECGIEEIVVSGKVVSKTEQFA